MPYRPSACTFLPGSEDNELHQNLNRQKQAHFLLLFGAKRTHPPVPFGGDTISPGLQGALQFLRTFNKINNNPLTCYVPELL